MLKLLSKFFPKDQSKYAVIYQWWVKSGGSYKVLENMYNPILLSIATIRRWCPDVKIYVMDYSKDEQDWGDFQDRLGFEVIRQRCGLSEVAFRFPKMPFKDMVPRDDRVFMENLSRPVDVWNCSHRVEEKYIISVDSDIFWTGSCIPDQLSKDRFHCRRDNSGLFFFDKESQKIEDFMHVWMGLSMLAAKNRRFRQRLYKDCPEYSAIQEEVTYVSIRKSMPELCNGLVEDLDFKWNFHPGDYRNHLDDISQIKAFHMMTGMYGKSRGLSVWMLKEFNPAIRQFFTESEIEQMFGTLLDRASRYNLMDTIRDGIMEKSVGAKEELKQFALDLSLPIQVLESVYKTTTEAS